ncbi:hypothetical protein CHS0354_025822 [Potamilus streckersoni]|uniref:Uncharacterized protein n=1 Tax=Potamilus streckersoni TaxID=2493646 RepID=A0AAE0VXX4_9BIVA|nr:hypothetical protein CHS0354_025822 [Potamilus streckersoni]
MATGGEETVGYSLAKVGTVTLERTNKSPVYISIVVCQDKMVVIDFKTYKVQLFRLHDGQLLATTDRLGSIPSDLCLMDAMTICVLHEDGLIKMVSIDCTDMSRVLKSTRDLRLQGIMNYYHGVVKFKDSLVVCGVKQGTAYWCIVSLHDGHVDAIHKICKWKRRWCRVTTKDNIVYVACVAGLDDTGVYGFDILNPSQCKYKYKHRRLQDPTSIVVNEDGNIFVCDGIHVDSCIHQLTASCQLVAIFTPEIPYYPLAVFLAISKRPRVMFWDNGRLYVTGFESHDITVFTHLYQGNHEDSEVGTSIEIEQGNVSTSFMHYIVY